MSIASAETSDRSLPVVNRQPGLIEQLLQQQSELTAVEQFSRWHEDSEAPAQEKYYQRLLPATPPGPGQQLAFEVDLDACSGCKACVVACHTLNGLEEEESWRRVGTLAAAGQDESPAGNDFVFGVQHVTTACHHCEDPGCYNGCPVKAYDKDPETGIVRHLDDQCIGCKYCTMMCPYEVPKYSDRLGIVRKCDMCHQRLSVGEAPACVQSCPNEAIKIRVVDVAVDSKEHDARLVPDAPLSSITRPTTRYVSKRDESLQSTRSQNAEIDTVSENHWPLVALLVATQAAVGMLVLESITFGIAFLTGQTLPAGFTAGVAVGALVLSGIGLGIAPLHLGQPLRSWRIFLGLRTSWLSREGVVLGKFAGSLAISATLFVVSVFSDNLPESVTGLLAQVPNWAPRVLLSTSVVLGLAGLFCSAMIYVATRRELWSMGRTLKRFFGTSAVGGLSMFTVAWISLGWTVPAIICGVLAAVLMAVKLGWEWKHHLGAASPDADLDSYAERSRRLVRRDLANLSRIRVRCGAAGIACVGSASLAMLFLPALATTLAVVACGLILAGEFSERLLYFSSVVHDRMPGTL